MPDKRGSGAGIPPTIRSFEFIIRKSTRVAVVAPGSLLSTLRPLLFPKELTIVY